MAELKNVEVSVLPWAPPVVHGLVRDLRVRWALEEAGCPYREHVLSPEQQASSEYRALQPFGQVPALKSGGVSLFESGAIVLHIAQHYPLALMSQEPGGHDHVMAWVFGVLNTVEPPVWTLTFIDVVYHGTKGEELLAFRARMIKLIESHLDTLTKVLDGKDYVLDRFTAVDILLTMVLRALRDTRLLEKRPTLAAYQHRCEARPAFQKALADQLTTFAEHAPGERT